MTQLEFISGSPCVWGHCGVNVDSGRVQASKAHDAEVRRAPSLRTGRLRPASGLANLNFMASRFSPLMRPRRCELPPLVRTRRRYLSWVSASQPGLLMSFTNQQFRPKPTLKLPSVGTNEQSRLRYPHSLMSVPFRFVPRPVGRSLTRRPCRAPGRPGPEVVLRAFFAVQKIDWS